MHSMTGYGMAEGKVGRGRLYVEIKSVNHRFGEINIKIPDRMSVLASYIRKHVQNKFSRGKIDVFFKEKSPLFGEISVSVDTELARTYQRVLRKLKRELGLKDDIDFFDTVGLERILKIEEKEGAYENLWGEIARLLDRAAANVIKMRSNEGLHIKRDQKKRLKKLESLMRAIRGKSKHVRQNHVQRIRHKMVDAMGNAEVDEQRLQMEAAYLGGRQDIAEEVVRLDSHIRQYSNLLASSKPVGRKMDFLLQEMNREINTIGAKAASAEISQLVVECKSELERLREQVQNVE